MDDDMLSDMESRMKDPKRRWADYQKLSSYDGVDALTVFWKESNVEEGMMFSEGKQVLISDFQKGVAEYGKQIKLDDE